MDTIVYSLAFKGLFSGNPQLIWDAPINIVMDAYHYARFMNVYDETSIMINRKKDK